VHTNPPPPLQKNNFELSLGGRIFGEGAGKLFSYGFPDRLTTGAGCIFFYRMFDVLRSFSLLFFCFPPWGIIFFRIRFLFFLQRFSVFIHRRMLPRHSTLYSRYFASMCIRVCVYVSRKLFHPFLIPTLQRLSKMSPHSIFLLELAELGLGERYLLCS